MRVAISRLEAQEISTMLPQLASLLQDAVASGASLGFLPPLAAADAAAYWEEVRTEVQAGGRLLLVARDAERNELLATGQLDLPGKPNARHRAEVAKLMVHTAARRRGLGRQLMLALEEQARQLGRSTLVLDTRQGDVSEQLYQSLQYQLAGVIPAYARSSTGQLDATAIYYKLLTSA